MYITGKIIVTTVIPDQLIKLKELAYNLWWTWNYEATELFREIDPDLWDKLNNNPVRFLQEVSRENLLKKVQDPVYMEKYKSVCQKYDDYMNSTDTWFSDNYPDKKDQNIAYFSAEYGLHEILPIYSGGLGVLSGDHCKSASDLGLPLTAIGLFYKHGYFDQTINREGWQLTEYKELVASHLPMTLVTDHMNQPIYINVEFPGRIIYARIWKVTIGRIFLYLIDTDVDKNNPQDRMITARLYGGDQETRIQQEILLGIGGYRVLKALGINATVFHMNEGHSAFLGLEIMRKLIQEDKLPFNVAKEVVASCVSFTTHTPVPAGNDVFPLYLIDKYFGNFWPTLGISREEFISLGRRENDYDNFNMTILAMKLAGRKNGVSKLHRAVTRKLFNNLWPGLPEDEVPVDYVTNGIHTLSWLSPEFRSLYDKYLDRNWEEKLCEKDIWDNIDNIPDKELWKAHCSAKSQMINFLRSKIREQRIKNNEPLENIKEVDTLLDPQALTIGFARRFATYKRANLIFRDLERARRLFNISGKPIQIIFAGKAHPADRPAQEVIKNIQDIAMQEGFKGKVILIENYNMSVARNLAQGVDLWMNNPRRPLEASGTSGQKVCINGIINFSVLDGWWCEGYNGKNGFVIGNDVEYDDEWYQDNADSASICDVLENQIIPIYFHRNEEGVPLEWVSIMKESIKSLTPQFNTHRMLRDYISKMYIPSMGRMDKITSSDYKLARELSDWKMHIKNNWHQVNIITDKSSNHLPEYKTFTGDETSISVLVNLGNINPDHVTVQLYYGYYGKDNIISQPEIIDMSPEEKVDATTYRYNCKIRLMEGGEYGYTFRVIPYNPQLIDKFEQGLIKWAVR
ncbi:MAG TPA: glycosyltransferase family 1 protein [Clostridiaceae bacterium]|nr:glycosyltransferase family 1 protein [Clostridiaceae bacterium]